MKRIFNIILLALAGIISTQAADVVIKGTVIAAEDGEPLIGATVVVTAKELKNAGRWRQIPAETCSRRNLSKKSRNNSHMGSGK